MFKPFSYYIVNIDLVKYLQSKGFGIDKVKTSKSCVVLKDGNGTVLLVRRNSDNLQYYYTNPIDATDRGNIVDFIAKSNKLNKRTDFVRINQLLIEAEGQGEVATHYFQHVKHSEQFDISLLVPLQDVRYLEHRGIKKDYLFAKPFLGHVLNHKKVLPDGRTFLNIAFPLTDSDEQIVGSEIKNFGFKGCAEGSLKEISIWHTDIVQNGFIGFSENPVDAISAHQLFLQDIKSIGYVSFGGAISEKQLVLVNQLIKNKGIRQVLLLFDNDLMGHFYDCLLSGALIFPEKGEGFRFNTILDNAKGIFHLIFHCHLPAKDFFKYKHLCEDNFHSIEGYKGYKSVGEIIYYEFELSIQVLSIVSEMVAKLRSLDRLIVKKKPKETFKDFNDELKGIFWEKDKRE